MSNLIFVGGRKGGASKTVTSHLICLGAYLKREPAAYILTDPERALKASGRPYGVVDGRDNDVLSQILGSAGKAANGWTVIDGGGNRPAFDKVVAEQVDLTILPFMASEEDVEMVAASLVDIPNAIAIPAAWTTNAMAKKSNQGYIDAVKTAFPGRIIETPLPFVTSAAELLASDLGNPSTRVRNAARRTFEIISEAFSSRFEPKATTSP